MKHHFVAFVLVGDKLIELDGTKTGPNIVSENCQDVLRGTIAFIQQKLEKGEISENLSMMTLNAA